MHNSRELLYMPFPANAALLGQFQDSLPKKPYCTNDSAAGLQIRNVKHALKYAYIQHNHPNSTLWLVFDIDRALCLHDITHDLLLPPPHFFVQNIDNCHAHVFYGLQVPVHHNFNSSAKAIRYAAAIDCALTLKLGADPNYVGLISKNPANGRWRTTVTDCELYELNYLEDFLDLAPFSDGRKRLPDIGLGRNCNLFDRLRLWGYKAIRQGWPDYDQWLRACTDRAKGYNQTDNPLPYPEVLHTAKSVAKWTHRNFSAEGFRDLQSARGSRKGQKVRDEKQDMALRLYCDGIPQTVIAEQLGVLPRTINNWLKPFSTKERHTDVLRENAKQNGQKAREDKLASARLMAAKGMSQRRIAEELGVSPMAISRWLKR